MTRSPRLQDLQWRVEYGVLRTVAAFFRSLPLNFATSASAFAWRTLAPIINPKRHKRALDNLAIPFPEKTGAERHEIALKHWENLGRVMVETMRIDRFLPEPERVEIVSQNIFSRYKDKLGAAIGVGLHMGNWELAVLPFTWAGANPAAVYRSVTNPYVDRYLRAQRADLCPGGLFGRGVVGEHGDDQRTARAIMDFVRRGGRLALVCDLYDRTRMLVPFFGKEAKTQAIAVIIARRVGARMWLSRAKRIGTASRFQIEIKELRVPRKANHADDIRWTMAYMQKDRGGAGAVDVEQQALELNVSSISADHIHIATRYGERVA
jgi:Kdo2-lipid IVA lauroyltransferase/acyltransferase